MTPERVTGGGVLAVLATLLALNVAFVARSCDALRPVQAGDRAPTFALPRADGSGTTSLAALTADRKVVLIDFWATWCGPCEQTMPMLKRLYAKHHDAGFEIVSVNTDGGPDAPRLAMAYRQSHGLPFPVVVDTEGVAEQYKVTAIPHMVLIDRDGKVDLVHIGALRLGGLEKDLDTRIAELLR